jgi:hypothetical protein
MHPIRQVPLHKGYKQILSRQHSFPFNRELCVSLYTSISSRLLKTNGTPKVSTVDLHPLSSRKSTPHSREQTQEHGRVLCC